MGAPAARAAELAHHWGEAGHDVTVLTGFPNHPTGTVPPEYRDKLWQLVYRETFHGANVVRTWLLPFPNRKSYERMLNYSSFCFSGAITGTFLPRPDVVIATSPQLLVGPIGWWTARTKHVPFVFEVRDLWPESLAAVGMGDTNSTLHRLLGKVAGFLYRNARHIVVVTPAFKDHLVNHWQVAPDKISVVENGVETGLFSPGDPDPKLRDQLGLTGKFVVCYIGTMGMAHGLETLVEAATRLQASRPEIAFLLVGEGAEKERIISLAHSRGLKNMCFIGQQPRERVPEFINASDAAVVLLKKTDLFRTVVPTKMLEFMSCARPVVLGVDGQARRLLDDAQAGIFVAPQNAQQLIDTIVCLADDLALRSKLGKNGRRYVQANLSREQTAHTYLRVLARLLGDENIQGATGTPTV